MEWYVIQVRSGKEHEFRHHSRKIIPPEHQAELFIPQRRMIIRRKGQELIEELPVFPGYVFLTTPELTPEQAGRYRKIEGFLKWVGSEGKPQIMQWEDLQILQQFLSHGEVMGISRVSYSAEMRIQVIDGPLKGLEGRIVRVDKRKRRAHVRLDMYHSSFEIDFSFELIEAQPKDTTANE